TQHGGSLPHANVPILAGVLGDICGHVLERRALRFLGFPVGGFFRPGVADHPVGRSCRRLAPQTAGRVPHVPAYSPGKVLRDLRYMIEMTTDERRKETRFRLRGPVRLVVAAASRFPEQSMTCPNPVSRPR